MVIIPLFFKLSFSQSKIYFFLVTGCCSTFVYNTFFSAIAIQGTIYFNSTVTITSLLCYFLNNLFVMSFDYLWHVLSTTIAYSAFSLKILCNLLERAKCLSIKFKNIFSALVDTEKLTGELNQMILCCCFRFALSYSWLIGVYISFIVCHIFSVLFHIVILELLNISALEEFRDNLALIRFVTVSILRLIFLKILIIFFRNLSTCLLLRLFILWRINKPLSLYRPILSFESIFIKKYRMYIPINW